MTKKREARDYLEATFGLLAVLHYTAREFRLYFVQAAGKDIRIWRFCLCDDKLYYIYKRSSSSVTLNSKESQDYLIELINNMWAFS
ncbi:hypothetical protein EDC94DRAFT_651835, partial [Helicostylum pulchrum]